MLEDYRVQKEIVTEDGEEETWTAVSGKFSVEFYGPNSRKRADDYAIWMNGGDNSGREAGIG